MTFFSLPRDNFGSSSWNRTKHRLSHASGLTVRSPTLGAMRNKLLLSVQQTPTPLCRRIYATCWLVSIQITVAHSNSTYNCILIMELNHCSREAFVPSLFKHTQYNSYLDKESHPIYCVKKNTCVSRAFTFKCQAGFTD